MCVNLAARLAKLKEKAKGMFSDGMNLSTSDRLIANISHAERYYNLWPWGKNYGFVSVFGRYVEKGSDGSYCVLGEGGKVGSA